MNILLSGGTGFIGQSLTKVLVGKGHAVSLLTRTSSRSTVRDPVLRRVPWIVGSVTEELQSAVNSADAVINLSGEPIAGKRWTKQQKERILSSRIDTTKTLVTAMAQAEKKPGVFISASGVGYYGNVSAGSIAENGGAGNDFLAKVCSKWEAEAAVAERSGIRVCRLRLGVVLGKGGGALPKLSVPFHFFAGGWLGSGDQFFPWIHSDDLADVACQALTDHSLSGAINVVAPEIESLKGFCKTLGKTLGRPCWTAVPSPVLRLLLGEMSETLLGGQPVVPKKLIDCGFRFRYPSVEQALKEIYGR